MKAKKVATLSFLILVVAIYAMIGFAADEAELYAEAEEVEYGKWQLHIKYTDPNNNPPEYIYFELNNKCYPAEPEECKKNWAKFSDFFVEDDPSDNDYTDGKWYHCKNCFNLGHYGFNYAHFYASDGDGVIEFPRVEWMDLCFGHQRHRAPAPTTTPYPYPYPYPYPSG